MNQQFQEELIKIYESEISLWKIKCSEYHDRTKKDVVYTKLVNKLREVEPNATKETVIKKINNYRIAFRKEQKKIKESMKSGAGADAVYTPKLWYFKLLSFLGDQDTPRTSITNLDADDGGDDDNDVENVEPPVEDTPVTHEENSNHSNAGSSVGTPRTRKRPRASLQEAEQECLANEVLQTVKEHYKRPRYQEDRFDVIGKTVAIKLRGLPKQQMLIADKLINDTLFQAEMGCLNLSHRLVGEANYQQQYPNHFGRYFPVGNIPVARSSTYYQESPHTSTSSSPIQVRGEVQNQVQNPEFYNEETASSFVSSFNENV